MNAQELFRAGKLDEAARKAGADLRDHPTDVRLRTFLFELLCFTGEFDRAGKHLSVLSQAGADAEIGTLLYRSAIVGERKRQAFFESGTENLAENRATVQYPGTINGKQFETLEDIDPRIGARLEVFVAGEYIWLPLEHIGSLRMERPRFLRDSLWATAQIIAGPAARGREFGEVLLPVLYPFTWRNSSDDVRLGHATEWVNLNGVGEAPVGQKLLVIDGSEELPFLEINEIVFHPPADGAPAEA